MDKEFTIDKNINESEPLIKKIDYKRIYYLPILTMYTVLLFVGFYFMLNYPVEFSRIKHVKTDYPLDLKCNATCDVIYRTDIYTVHNDNTFIFNDKKSFQTNISLLNYPDDISHCRISLTNCKINVDICYFIFKTYYSYKDALTHHKTSVYKIKVKKKSTRV